jgi:HTH-type transcriptional regulator/antitoxin HigA
MLAEIIPRHGKVTAPAPAKQPPSNTTEIVQTEWRSSAMSTVLANPAEMIRQGAPRLLHTDDELAEYTAALMALTAKKRPTVAEDEAIQLLTVLIEQYESQHYPVPDASPVEVLRFLLESNGLSQCDLVSELGSEATVSLVLSGKRPLTRTHIERLSRRFHVSPSVFFES